MKMVFRWFAGGYDSISLRQIRQIPGMSGVAASLLDIPVGEVWPLDRLEALKSEIESEGLSMDVIESVNIHEDIKLGKPERNRYLEAYRQTLRNLSKAGVKVLCYNFMPVLDWARSELQRPLPDGSTTMAYRDEPLQRMDPQNLAGQFGKESNGFELPGWEPGRLKEMSAVIAEYHGVTEDQYWENIRYFLNAVIPTAEEVGIRMAIHPDDPPWPLFGLPRVITCRENIRKFLSLYDSPFNGLTFCTGSLGSNRGNDLPSMIREFAGQGRVPFAHIRNLKFEGERDFYEASHLSSCGSFDMYEIVKAFCDSGFDGYIRPDHGRMIWGEQGRPGYGLYDRAMGSVYLQGLWEAVQKAGKAYHKER